MAIKRPPKSRTAPKTQADELSARIEHYLKLMSPDRLDRIEANIERLSEENRKAAEENRKAAEENERFHLAMRGATTSLYEQQQKNSRDVAALLKAVAKHDQAIANLERQWGAYLSTIPPKQ